MKAWHAVVFRTDAARLSARITGSSYRLVQGLFWVIASSVACTGNAVLGQPQTQIQYTYDAAGNVIQAVRSAVVPKPDLTVSNLTVGTIAANANGSYNVPVTFQVNNIGNAVATATWYDRGYLSANTVLHDTDQALGGYNTRSTNLAVGASYAVSTTFTTTTPTTAGNYTLIVWSMPEGIRPDGPIPYRRPMKSRRTTRQVICCRFATGRARPRR